MNNLILTTKGKLKIKQYIEICKKKKKRILELGLDTAEKTKIRSLTDIYIELNVDPYVIDAEGVTYSFYKDFGTFFVHVSYFSLVIYI